MDKIKLLTLIFCSFGFIKAIFSSKAGCVEQSLVGGNNLSIPDSSYTASSYFDYRFQPHNAKLHSKYGWAARDNSNPDDYLQIDLGTPRVITAVATQGNGGDPDSKHHKTKYEWVTSYRLDYSNDSLNWIRYKNNYGRQKIFDGNIDSNGVKRHDLSENPITARYIRFVPVTFKSDKTMRVDITVTTQEAPVVTAIPHKRSIQLSWTIKQCNSTGSITGFAISNGSKDIHVSSSERQYTLSGLKPYTDYDVSVLAKTQRGNGVWSETKRIRTTIAEPEASPQVEVLRAMLLRSLLIRWKLQKPELVHGPLKGYRITYTPQGGRTNVLDVGDVTTYNLTSLLKYTTYTVTIAVINEKFVGPPSTATSTRTLEDAPETSPVIIGIEPRSSESILLKWKKVDRNDINGIFKAYRITYTPQGGRPNILDVGDVTTYNLTSLLKYTTYTVTVAVMNEKFVGPPSTELSIRTLEDAPSAPVNLKANLIHLQDLVTLRVVITWDRPRDPNGIIRKYTIVYYYNKDESRKTIVTINGTNDLKYIIDTTRKGKLSYNVSATTIEEGPYAAGEILLVYQRSCPRGWLTYRGSRSCYRLGGTSKSWTEARKACFAMGGDLVKINSAQENKYVALLARTIPRHTGRVWIGLVGDRSNKFTWIDGTSLSGQYSNWGSGEPNNHLGTKEDCGEMHVGSLKWNDVPCVMQILLAYICEK